MLDVGYELSVLGPVHQKIVNFNPGLSQVILSKDMQLKVTKYCWAVTPKYSHDNTKFYSKQYIGR